MASNPRVGDMMLAMAFRPEGDGPFGGFIGFGFVVRVHENNVIDAMFTTVNPSDGVTISWATRYGLTEVATIAEVNAGVPESPGVAFVPGTWCRREVCG